MGKRKDREQEMEDFEKEQEAEQKCDCEKQEKECQCDDCQCDECQCDNHEECECTNCDDSHRHKKRHEHCDCQHHGHEQMLQQKVEEYLAVAQRLQADFENYRKRVAEQLDLQKTEGVKSVLEVFLPCLDTFKEAKKSVSDESTLAGINMIENKILEGLDKLGVKKIETVGQKYDPHLHNVVAVFKDESKDEDIILDEFQAGWTMNDKVIRYAKVVVNKLD